jgi:hypothetical protein
MKPKCCNKDAVWVDMGPKLQYYFCKECRKEVKEEKEEVKKEIHQNDDIWDHLYYRLQSFY